MFFMNVNVFIRWGGIFFEKMFQKTGKCLGEAQRNYKIFTILETKIKKELVTQFLYYIL